MEMVLASESAVATSLTNPVRQVGGHDGKPDDRAPPRPRG